MTDSAVIFVHGLFSSPKSWSSIESLIRSDPDLTGHYDLLFFKYDTRRWQLSPAKSIPDFDLIADSLSTYLDLIASKHERLVLISHSQGGIVILRYLAKMLADGRGVDLARIRRIVLFACPNNGSEFLLTFRKASSIVWRNPQERQLRPLADSVTESLRRVLRSVVFATSMAPDRCPIPIIVYAGESDNVVTSASAKSVFRDSGVLPGDHFSLIRPDSHSHLTYRAVRENLLRALTQSAPRTSSSRERTQQGSPAEETVYTEFTTFEPLTVLTRSGDVVRFIVHAGPADQISDVDIVVSSENTYYQMAKPYKPSTSGRLRRAAARKNDAGEIIEDIAFDELNTWMKEHGRHGLPVGLGTVAPTSSGQLAERNVRRIYHAAVVVPRVGTNDYDVEPQALATAVHNVFALARTERAEIAVPVNSVCFPLFGAGRGRLDPRTSFDWMWKAMEVELAKDPSWTIHFMTWGIDETRMLLEELRSRSRDD